MIPDLPTYTLLMITSFFNGPIDHFPFPGALTEETCNREAAERRSGWELYGDKTFVKNVSYACIPNRIIIP